MGLNAVTGLIRRKEEFGERQTQKENGQLKTKAVIRVMFSQTKLY